MKRKAWVRIGQLLCLSMCLIVPGIKVYASEGEGEQYITISVEATDESGKLMYALDSDDPMAFSESNEFSVPAGTSHTIYVKDEAGNITSQMYEANMTESMIEDAEQGQQQINIDLEIGNSGIENANTYEYLTDTPVEKGQGTVADKTVTDGSTTDSKVFYTITTAEGEVFYMIIDQGQSTDNVYLLTQVTKNDLQVLAESGSEGVSEDSLLESLNTSDVESSAVEAKEIEKEEEGTNTKWILCIVFMIIVGGVYYYIKIYKPKKEAEMDLEDAMDIEEFEMEDEDEEEEEYDLQGLQEEKKRILERIMQDDNKDEVQNDSDEESEEDE